MINPVKWLRARREQRRNDKAREWVEHELWLKRLEESKKANPIDWPK